MRVPFLLLVCVFAFVPLSPSLHMVVVAAAFYRFTSSLETSLINSGMRQQQASPAFKRSHLPCGASASFDSTTKRCRSLDDAAYPEYYAAHSAGPALYFSDSSRRELGVACQWDVHRSARIEPRQDTPGKSWGWSHSDGPSDCDSGQWAVASQVGGIWPGSNAGPEAGGRCGEGPRDKVWGTVPALQRHGHVGGMHRNKWMQVKGTRCPSPRTQTRTRVRACALACEHTRSQQCGHGFHGLALEPATQGCPREAHLLSALPIAFHLCTAPRKGPNSSPPRPLPHRPLWLKPHSCLSRPAGTCPDRILGGAGLTWTTTPGQLGGPERSTMRCRLATGRSAGLQIWDGQINQTPRRTAQPSLRTRRQWLRRQQRQRRGELVGAGGVGRP